MNYQKYTRFYNNLYFQIIIKIFYFLLIFIDNLYAKNKVPISYGGELNTTFGRLAGVRAGGGRISGYGWLSSYHKIDEKHYITGNAGISLEGKTSNKLILNDLSIGLHDNKSQFFLGRTLSAAGKLHHDIIDFGAPGGGSDNTPVSYFYNGNYTTNVAQKLTLPFSERIAYYIKPYKDYFAIGISYAPNIGTYHPENYQFFAQTPVKDEISFAINNEIQISNFYIGITGGYTQAYRPFNRLNSQGLIKSTQYSFFVKQALNQRSFYNLYELNHGCLEDKAVDDSTKRLWITATLSTKSHMVNCLNQAKVTEMTIIGMNPFGPQTLPWECFYNLILAQAKLHDHNHAKTMTFEVYHAHRSDGAASSPGTKRT